MHGGWVRGSEKVGERGGKDVAGDANTATVAYHSDSSGDVLVCGGAPARARNSSAGTIFRLLNEADIHSVKRLD